MTTKKKIEIKPQIRDCPYCKHSQATRKRIGNPICCSKCHRWFTVKSKR